MVEETKEKRIVTIFIHIWNIIQFVMLCVYWKSEPNVEIAVTLLADLQMRFTIFILTVAKVPNFLLVFLRMCNYITCIVIWFVNTRFSPLGVVLLLVALGELFLLLCLLFNIISNLLRKNEDDAQLNDVIIPNTESKPYSECKEFIIEPTCSICYEDYKEDDQIIFLNCSHEFHSSCITKWGKHGNGQCPICRILFLQI
jgi:hypothetical protein